jgi:hypothetical protein
VQFTCGHTANPEKMAQYLEKRLGADPLEVRQQPLRTNARAAHTLALLADPVDASRPRRPGLHERPAQLASAVHAPLQDRLRGV